MEIINNFFHNMCITFFLEVQNIDKSAFSVICTCGKNYVKLPYSLKEAILDNNKMCDAFTNAMKANTNDYSYSTWFSPLYLKNVDEELGLIYIASKETFNVEFLKNNYMPIIEKTFNTLTDKNYKIIIKHENDFGDKPAKKSKSVKNEFTEENIFNPRFTFDNFVVGSSNKFAHAASLAVAEVPGEAYNPLFIYGGSGLGKTHLMQAIGVHIGRTRPDYNVLYVSSEMFTNELIKAIRENKTRSFRNKYRKVDVLLIDDIQFLQGKESIQEEFFHTFNTLHENNKQIVITSDCPPVNLKDLDERLRTRFSWNMIADIQPPDYETRLSILYNFAEKSDVELTPEVNEVCCLIADLIKDNIRELEGAWSRVLGFSKLIGTDISLDNAKKVLNDLLANQEEMIAPERIKAVVAQHFNITVADMDSPKRKAEINFPRQIAMYLIRNYVDISLPKIGKLFGDRHYSTVIHAVEKIEKDLGKNEYLRTEIDAIKKKLNLTK